jgi:hypothetical protein
MIVSSIINNDCEIQKINDSIGHIWDECRVVFELENI